MTEPSITPEVQPAVRRGLMRHRTLVKLGGIAALASLLLVPLALLVPVVEDRAALRDGAVADIQRDWGRAQSIVGPVVVIPLERGVAFVFPDTLRVNGEVVPQRRHRGIYEAIVYTARLEISGTFHRPAPAELGVPAEQIRWDQAYLALGVTDLRGTATEVSLRWGATRHAMRPGSQLERFVSGVHTPITLTDGETAFALDLPVHGSDGIRFAPLGVQNEVSLRSPWPNPSFAGAFLPTTRDITDDGFTSTWAVSHYGRDFGQYAIATLPYGIDPSLFGVDLEPGIDSYRSVDRAIRYGVLFVVLAFMSFFLFEVISRTRIHPFQYAMIGLALGVFFLLLLALSELAPFAVAYGAAAAGTIALVASYMVPVLKTGTRTLVAAAILAASFAVIYVVLQAEDYALLAGSLVVFAALAVTMRLTRRLDWYGEDEAGTATPPQAPTA